ncbi:MAG: serine/threonine protein kinase [Sinobacteraceae bacterium]|nr:serine/threonine protein kinase [Nevskiaceae bacterium]
MRLLLIEDDAAQCEIIQHRLKSRKPDAQIVVRNPDLQGPLAPEFLAQGFDAVLLGDGRGLDELRDLIGRAGFAPIIFIATHVDGNEARDLGAHAVLSRDEIQSEHFFVALADAEWTQSRARQKWQTSPAGRDTQRFGSAFIRGYRCIRRIASGPISDLYLAESEAAGALVALKVVRDRNKDQHDLDHTFRRFLQEYEIVQRIKHPSVVQLYDLGISDDHAWLVMEYFKEGDLRRRMRAGMRPRPALRAAISIARALEAMHAAGVLHRDLKPGNVMLREDGTPALIDFGMSKDTVLAHEVTDTGLIFGTPHYMSPEQGHGEPIDARSDIYSLGVIVYEMLTREKPFAAENPMAIIYKHRKEPVPQLPARFAELQPLVARLLAKEACDRYADAAQVAAALEDAHRLLRNGSDE